jgi:O-antigen ligase
MIGAILWVLGLVFTIAVLVITQSRGSVLSLGLVAAGYGLVLVLRRNRGEGHTGPRPALVIASALLLLALMSLVLWSSRERSYFDFESLVPAAGEVASTHEGLGYVSSTAIRINLYDLGLRLFAARPLLGWGPGTGATEYLVRKRVIPLSERHLPSAPQASHLHSVPIEILVRFGLVGLALGFLTLSLIIGAYRRMWSWSADPALKLFLVAGGLLALLFVLFDFRLIHLDFRFFFIVFFGILYSYRFVGSGPAGQPRGGAPR